VFEGFRLDAHRRVLSGVEGQPIALTPRLFDTLLYLVEHAGHLLTKEQLLEDLWPNVIVEEHNLNKTISELRRVLGEKPGEHKFIVTKPGRGYRFVAEVSVASNLAAGHHTFRADVRAAPSEAEVVHAVPPGAPPSAPTVTSYRRYWRAAALGAAAIVIAAVVFGFFGTTPDPLLRTKPWAADKGGQWSPVWSQDSRATAFVARDGANEPAKIYIRSLDEPVARVIARGPFPFPAIAQWTTGGKILFWQQGGLWSVSPVGAPPELVVPLDGPRLGAYPVPMRMAHVTRDGATMAMVARGEDGVFGVWTATPPSAKLERYEPAPFAARTVYQAPFLRFSPDGNQLLLFWYAGDRGEEAWLIPFPSDARHPPRRILDRLPKLAATPEFSWFPDNRHIVVSTGLQLPQRGLYLADTQSQQFRPLPTGPGDQTDPVVSPDGSKLVLTELRREFDIATLDVKTAAVTVLGETATDRAEIFPSWAADTNALIYVTDRSGPWEIWLHQPPQPDRPLVTGATFKTGTLGFIAPTLSPDGARVIYQRVEAPEDTSRLWMAAVVGGAPERVTHEEAAEGAGSWSPDGAWYVYVTNEPEGSTTLKKVKTTGQAAPETLLRDLKPTAFSPVWSPDGAWLLAWSGNRMLLVSADGKTTRDLGLENALCAFARSEDLLYCIREVTGIALQPLPFVAVDFYGKVVRTIGSLAPKDMPSSPVNPGLRLSPTPNGDGLTYSIGNRSQALWILEGLDKIKLP
jgi:DNA-binding winged helix-turn-helix (wHTH) protein/Tol biopolymer transport system component